MYNPSMASVGRATTFPVSLYATPSTLYQELFYTVLRAGHLQAGPGYGVKRDHFPGHELILSLSGRSIVVVSGVLHDVKPGDFVWFNCQHPHEHRADMKDPWDALWARVDGPRLDRTGAMLEVETSPVISGIRHEEAKAVLLEIIDQMQRDHPDSAPMIHAGVAKLVALACCARRLPAADVDAPSSMKHVIERMRQDYFKPFTLAELAAGAGMSSSHFSRVFRKAFSASPIDWLRRERVNQAKRRLSETNDPVQWIAEQVGYRDRFFFSKDFRKMTGMTPREFRRREVGGDRA